MLLDIQLPTVDGFEVLCRLRGAGVDVPVLAVSANAMAADIERAIAAGFAEYLAKPLDVQRVLATIAAHLPAAAPRH